MLKSLKTVKSGSQKSECVLDAWNLGFLDPWVLGLLDPWLLGPLVRLHGERFALKAIGIWFQLTGNWKVKAAMEQSAMNAKNESIKV